VDPVDAKETTPIKDGDSEAKGPEFVDAMNSKIHLSITMVTEIHP